MNYRRFHQTTVLDWGQEQHTVHLPNGGVSHPSKKRLARTHRHDQLTDHGERQWLSTTPSLALTGIIAGPGWHQPMALNRPYIHRETNLRLTQQAYDAAINLIQEFTDFVEQRYAESESEAA